MKKNYCFIFLICILYGYTIKGQELQTISLRPGPEDGIDAEIRTDMNWPIWYEDDFISNAWTVQGDAFIQRSLLKFDLSALPEGAEIISAKLSLFCNTMSGHHQLHAGENASYLLRITEPWDQYQVTWNTQPGITMEDAVMLPKTTSMTQDLIDIDVTEFIRYFKENPQDNHGMMLKLVEEVQLSAMVFSSSNHSDPSKRPLLIISYNYCHIPQADFKYIKLNNSNLVQFIADSIDAVNYWWDFGDEFYSTEGSPLHFYSNPGNYEVCLKVSNSCGESTYCDSIQICTETVEGSFAHTNNVNLFTFTPITSDDEVDFYWDFGDGFYSDLDRPSHLYINPGFYDVCLYASNRCNQLIACDSIFFDGIDQTKQPDNKLVVYPNPSYGLVQINHTGEQSEFKTIRVINFNGTEILNEGNSRLKKNNEGFSCDFTGMETGIYTIQVITTHGVFSQKAIVVTN